MSLKIITIEDQIYKQAFPNLFQKAKGLFTGQGNSSAAPATPTPAAAAPAQSTIPAPGKDSQIGIDSLYQLRNNIINFYRMHDKVKMQLNETIKKFVPVYTQAYQKAKTDAELAKNTGQKFTGFGQATNTLIQQMNAQVYRAIQQVSNPRSNVFAQLDTQLTALIKNLQQYYLKPAPQKTIDQALGLGQNVQGTPGATAPGTPVPQSVSQPAVPVPAGISRPKGIKPYKLQ